MNKKRSKSTARLKNAGARGRKIAVIDAETDPFLFGRCPKPFLWGFYDGDQYLEFTDARDLVEHVRYSKYLIYAHNGGKFDYKYMLDHINDLSRVMLISGRLAKFSIGASEFRDSYSILPIALAKWSKEKINYKIFEEKVRMKADNYNKIRAYLKSDCLSLYEMVEAFTGEYGRKLTQASAAVSFWENQSGIARPRTSPEFYKVFKDYYYGGRVEAVEQGEHHMVLRGVDINSAYPKAMTSTHPYGSNAVILRGRQEISETSFYKVSCASSGAFPMRADDNALSFPNDGVERTFTITGHELIAAIETKTCPGLKIVHGIRLEESITFNEYVEHFYDKRAKAKAVGDKAGDLFSKLLMNSLYGKLGCNPEKYKDYIVASHDDVAMLRQEDCPPELDGYTFAGIFGSRCLLQRDVPEDKQHFYNVATAASITGYVRAFLWRSMQQCDGVKYVDTDSILAKDTSRLERGGLLGQWKLEGTYRYAAIAGKKLYALKGVGKGEWKVASKGVRLLPEQIIAICRGDVVEAAKDAPNFSYKNKTQEKEKKNMFTKRKIKLLNKKT